MGSGRWAVVCGWWSLVCGLWSVDFGLWLVVCRTWSVAGVQPSGEDPKHLFEYAQANVDGDSCQETVHLENLDEDGPLDLQADAPLLEKHIMATTFAAPSLPVHGKGSKFAKFRVLPPK